MGHYLHLTFMMGGVTWFNAIIVLVCNPHFLDFDWAVNDNRQLTTLICHKNRSLTVLIGHRSAQSVTGYAAVDTSFGPVIALNNCHI